MNFELSEEQISKLEEWKKAIKVIYGEYGLFTYCFSPNGIGMEIKVYSDLANATLDLTEIDKW